MAWSSIPLLLTFAVASTAGYKCLFIGHSFFRPIATQLPELVASVAGVTHEQSEVFSGGESGTPSRLWENPQKRYETQSTPWFEPSALHVLFCSPVLTLYPISCLAMDVCSHSRPRRH